MMAAHRQSRAGPRGRSVVEVALEAGALHARADSEGAPAMKSKLMSAAIAATIFASSSVVAASQSSETDTEQARSQEKASPDEAARSGGAKPAKRRAGKKADPKAGKKGKSGEPDSERLERETDEAPEPNAKAEDVAGQSPRDEAEEKARAAREREAQDRKDAQDAGEAVGRATTTAAIAIVQAERDVTRALDQPGKYNAVAATWNPLGMIVGGRVSFNVEYAPLTHHVIIVSPHFASPSQRMSDGTDSSYEYRFTGVGGEIGYRYYTGHRGMNGIFIGPSLIGGMYDAKLGETSTLFTNIGLAADLGIQQIFFDHLALGAGAGIEYLYVSKVFGELATSPSTIAVTGLKPRLLAQAGYAF